MRVVITELKPCPKCKQDNIIVEMSSLDGERIYCRDCEYSTRWHWIEGMARKEWNGE